MKDITGLKLAIVDDTKISALALGKMLDKKGAITFTFINGLEILERIQEDSNAFDCIIMDVFMPKMDGVEATKQIKKICNIPVIGLTACDNDPTASLMIDAGMYAFLLKPCPVSKMETLIIKAILDTKKNKKW